jgi:hypothetical protein
MNRTGKLVTLGVFVIGATVSVEPTAERSAT